jgi:hypothetical protein
MCLSYFCMFVAFSGWVELSRKYRTFFNFFGRTTGADISLGRQIFLAFHGTRRIVCVFNRQPFVPALSQMHPLRHPSIIYSGSILILSSYLLLDSRSNLFPSGYRSRTLYTFRIFASHATCPAYLIFLSLITRKIFGE